MEELNRQEDDTIMNDNDIEDVGDTDDEVYGLPSVLDKKTFQKLKRNDPTITNLCITFDIRNYDECFFNSIDWKVDGNCLLANNTQLKKLSFNNATPYSIDDNNRRDYILGEQRDNLPTRQQLQDFFSCICRNQSINGLSISSIRIVDTFGRGLIKGLQGHPSIKRLDIMNAKIGDSFVGLLGDDILNHPKSKLKDLRLSNCHLDDRRLDILCRTLLGNGTLKKLCLTGHDSTTSVGWQALSTLLQSPHCKLIELELGNTGINDEEVDILGTALTSSSVNALDLSCNDSISSEGWSTLLNQLSHTSMEKLILSDNEIDDTDLVALANMCGNMKILDLCGNKSITPTGWRSFFDTLRRREVQLKELYISSNNISNECAAALGNLIRSMGAALKELCMHFMDSYGDEILTSQGWVSLFTTLQGSNLDLTLVDFSFGNIDDEGMQLLVPLVSRMSSLKELRLNDNHSVTPSGWRRLSELLQSPNSTLRQLDLDNNAVNDDVIVAFSSDLVHNKTLNRLSLDECTDDNDNDLITDRGWDAISTLVCNKTSIMDTYFSNHTFQSVCFDRYYEPNLPFGLKSYLDLNGNTDKSEVARQKILQTHFSNEGDTSKILELLNMELEMMPTVIEWIGRPAASWSDANVSGLSAMFNLMRRVPDIFDSNAKRKATSAKRKRCE